jgi:hypothetical protein
VAIISYDEKPGIQAIATTAPDLPPEPGMHATFAREHEYKRYGTVSLLGGIDLVTGKVHALVRDGRSFQETSPPNFSACGSGNCRSANRIAHLRQPRQCFRRKHFVPGDNACNNRP